MITIFWNLQSLIDFVAHKTFHFVSCFGYLYYKFYNCGKFVRVVWFLPLAYIKWNCIMQRAVNLDITMYIFDLQCTLFKFKCSSTFIDRCLGYRNLILSYKFNILEGVARLTINLNNCSSNSRKNDMICNSSFNVLLVIIIWLKKLL